MANTAPEYREAERTQRERETAAASGRAVVEDATGARGAVTGHNVQYVLLVSLVAVVVAFAVIYTAFWT